jgi:hypothetical protein
MGKMDAGFTTMETLSCIRVDDKEMERVKR